MNSEAKALKEQIKELQRKLAKMEKEPKVWKPEKGEDYYYITLYGDIVECTFENGKNFFVDCLYVLGNIFKTQEEAYKVIEKIKIYVKLKRYAEEHNTEPIDWNDKNRAKYFIKLYNNKLIFDDVYSTRVMNQIYFSSTELGEKAIEEIGEDNIKKLFEDGENEDKK